MVRFSLVIKFILSANAVKTWKFVLGIIYTSMDAKSVILMSFLNFLCINLFFGMKFLPPKLLNL